MHHAYNSCATIATLLYNAAAFETTEARMPVHAVRIATAVQAFSIAACAYSTLIVYT